MRAARGRDLRRRDRRRTIRRRSPLTSVSPASPPARFATRTSRSTGSITSGRTWSRTRRSSRRSRRHQDLQNALTHEMGHLIGLDHTCWSGPTSGMPDPLDNIGNPVPECNAASADVQATTMFPSASPRRHPEAHARARRSAGGVRHLSRVANDPKICAPNATPGGCNCSFATDAAPAERPGHRARRARVAAVAAAARDAQAPCRARSAWMRRARAALRSRPFSSRSVSVPSRHRPGASCARRPTAASPSTGRRAASP